MNAGRYLWGIMACCLMGLSAIAPVMAETIGSSKVPGIAPPACEEETQMALNRCAARWARATDFLRSLVYEEVYQQLTEVQQSQLNTIEQTWYTFRDAHCNAWSEPFRDGSIYALIYQSCRARVTNDRIADLQGLGNAEILPETLQRLTTIVNELSASSGQRSWERYQKLHCQFEATRFPVPQQVEQCNLRLSATRLRQIEEMQWDR
jgi:uncharacterized protein YecT (DUF1311 family)